MLCPDGPFDVLIATAVPPPVPAAVELADATPEPTAEARAVALAAPALPCWGPLPAAPPIAFAVEPTLTPLRVDVSAILAVALPPLPPAFG